MTTRTGPLFTKVALLGVGLIGASMAHAIRRGSLAAHIAGHTRSPVTRKRASEIGFCHSMHEDPLEAVRDADLVVLCTPVGVFGDVARTIAPALKPGAILTDVGSVKTAVVRDVGPHVPDGVHFIPGHPIAGTEHSGPDAGFAELFDGRWCVLTPLPGADEAAVERLKTFWKGCGSRVEVMDPKHHDLVLAITSHVPHLIAYNIVGTASDLEQVTQSEVIKFSAGGFRDFTRIASSSPEMWRDIAVANRDALLGELRIYQAKLQRLQQLLETRDKDGLAALFAHARTARNDWLARQP